MEQMKFTGWIEKILEPNDWDHKFVVANYRDSKMHEELRNRKGEFPNALQFNCSVKNGCNAQLDGLREGDKVQILFYLAGRSGISKNGSFYCINNLNVAKQNGIVLLERNANVNPDSTDTPEDADVPF